MSSLGARNSKWELREHTTLVPKLSTVLEMMSVKVSQSGHLTLSMLNDIHHIQMYPIQYLTILKYTWKYSLAVKHSWTSAEPTHHLWHIHSSSQKFRLFLRSLISIIWSKWIHWGNARLNNKLDFSIKHNRYFINYISLKTAARGNKILALLKIWRTEFSSTFFLS